MTDTTILAPPTRTVSPSDFRQTFSEVPTPVFIIATDGPAGRAGLTASSVTSVSTEPPTMLTCIHSQSSCLQVFCENGRFSVNLLAQGHAEIAARFAGMTEGNRGEDRFTLGSWASFTSGGLALSSAVFSLDCRLTSVESKATHALVFGEVEDVRQAPQAKETLVYHRRAFCSA